MTWTYSWDQLNKPVYAVRRMIGDVNVNFPLMQDEEINYFIGGNASLIGAAADICRALATQFSVSVDQTAGGQTTKFSQMATAFAARALRLDALAAQTAVAVGSLPGGIAGGISTQDVLNWEGNTAFVPPVFSVGMHDNRFPVPPAGAEQTAIDEAPETHE